MPGQDGVRVEPGGDLGGGGPRLRQGQHRQPLPELGVQEALVVLGQPGGFGADRARDRRGDQARGQGGQGVR
ncbi:MAG: hypothetical protein V9G19_23470 [Tetrasphaera sp.]